MENHKYGTFHYNKWYDLHGHCKGHNDNKIFIIDGYQIKFFDNKDKSYQIKGPNSVDLCSRYGYYNVAYQGQYINISNTHLMLASAFPNQEPDETVDHINDDSDDNRLINLQWMSRSENSRKGQIKSVKKTNENGGRKGVYVDMFNKSLLKVLPEDTIPKITDYAKTLPLTDETIHKAVKDYLAGKKDIVFKHGKMSKWDVSRVTSMRELFKNAEAFNQPLNKWDVSNVTTMINMFAGATSFNQPLNEWDVSNVTDMRNMFSDATAFNQPLNNWDVSNVEEMWGMFEDATNFNQPLNEWDVSNVKEMRRMFYRATSFNQPLNEWNVTNVTNMYTSDRSDSEKDEDEDED